MGKIIFAWLVAFCGMALAGSPIFEEANRIEAHVSFTAYDHHTSIDENLGTYRLDCSAFANYVLSRSAPLAFQELADNAVNPSRPLARDYVSFFRNRESHDIANLWLRIIRPSKLRQGDFVAWLIPPESTSADTGHVMIVNGVVSQNENNPNEWLIPVVDSAVSGHGSADPRKSTGPNGIGHGMIGLITDDSGKKVIGFRWSGNESPKIKLTEVRMGRVRNLKSP
jgi:hypothetical protein